MSDVAQVRRAGRPHWIPDVLQDLRYAARTLRASRGFAAVAVFTLALGIGATTATYSIVNTILLRPLPFTDSDRVVRIIQHEPSPGAGVPDYERGRTWQEYLEWRARATTLSDVIGIAPSIALVKTSQGTARLWGGMVSGSTFTTLGARAMVGRTLLASDDANPDSVLLTHAAWRRLFHTRDIVGQRVDFLTGEHGSRPMTVVGVMPEAFEFPIKRIEFFTPFTPGEAAWKNYSSIELIGRLRPGVSLDVAAQEAMTLGSVIAKPLPAGAPPLPMPRFEVQPLKEGIVRELRPALRVFLGAVGVVLLIVCANVANLLLVRGTGRQREMAVRSAIGASRGRLVRQLLTECVVLAAAGGLIGAALGAGGIALVKQMAAIEAPGVFQFSLGSSILPRVHELRIDPAMFAVSFGLAAVSILVFGLLPALHVSRSSPVRALAARGAGGVSRGASRLRALLVLAQLVLATMLLVGAGLLIHSFGRLLAVDRGYDPSHVLAFQLVFPPDYSIARKTETIEGVLARLRTLPDAVASGFTRHGMMVGEQIMLGTFVPQGRTLAEMQAQPKRPSLRPVSGGYLSAVGARMIQGTDLNPHDLASPPAIVVSQGTARIFGGSRQIGRFVDWHIKGNVIPLQVVGVVSDLRNVRADRDPFPEVFMDYRTVLNMSQMLGEAPLWQHERALGLLSFSLRLRGDPEAAVPVVSRIVQDVDPNAGIDAILPLPRLVAGSIARPRFYAVLLGTFATVAALLAVIGIYGVLAYTVSQRTQEIGIRMALGAQRRQVLVPVLRRGLLLAICGIALGLVGASAGTRLLQGMLFGITPLDSTTFGAVALLFIIAAALASYVPARRATRVDPMLALRQE